MINIKILTYPIRKREYETFAKNEGLSLLRFDSQYLLGLKIYENFLRQFKANKIDLVSFGELGTLRKGQEKSNGVEALGIMVKSISKLTIHPLKLEPKNVSKTSLVKPQDLVIISTGLGSIGRSGIIPRYFISGLAKIPLAVTRHVIKFEIKNKVMSPYYVVALLNSYYGKLLIEKIATYGATGQLEVNIEALSRLKLPVIDIHKRVANIVKSAIEEYEAKAWNAYFKAISIINEYVDYKDSIVTGTAFLKNIKALNRCDSSGILAQLILTKVAEIIQAPIIPLSQLFTIKRGNVPWTSEYISKEKNGIPYIGIDAIDDSGIIDNEKLDYMPEHLFKPSFIKTNKGEILLVKDGNKAGKVGMTYEPIYVREGIYILKPRQHTDISYYVMALLKSKLYKKVFKLLSYGMAQPHLSSEVIETLPILMLRDKDEIASHMKEFVENIYQANALKTLAVAELNNYTFKLIQK